MSEEKYQDFSKSELITYLDLCDEFFDRQGMETHFGGGVLSPYGRLIKFAEMKNNELAALRARVAELEKERDDLFKAAELMACFLTNVNTINDGTTARLIQYLKSADCEGLADALAMGGFASALEGVK